MRLLSTNIKHGTILLTLKGRSASRHHDHFHFLLISHDLYSSLLISNFGIPKDVMIDPLTKQALRGSTEDQSSPR